MLNRIRSIKSNSTNSISTIQWQLSPRERIWDAIICSLNMSDIQIVLLQHETDDDDDDDDDDESAVKDKIK